jgi:hypothetical protein
MKFYKTSPVAVMVFHAEKWTTIAGHLNELF